ncbi:putative siderophore transport system ATP-binding protein YusV [Saccharicrinis fermentans DSM 9555 = JCM 21142]|uniref:Putative siderophore transport system ATP-binding protein YusV n=2 Tax=Saccharicrinis fermentans TaxID=982 RepID=W7Y1V3_9BACT|nr:putative siderophore transport system ATP-binding protein YusV [Saccharicrinis fermentans DSM 9555 = JCM 21142]
MPQNMFLATENLAVGYDKHGEPLHQNIQVSIKAGQFICLLGPNGAGKSTLIKTLSGFLKPLYGQVWYGQDKIETLSEAHRAKRVSVVLTDRLDVQNLTVFELVALGRTPYTGFFGKLMKKDVELVLHAIEEVGLNGYAQKPIDKMSDGERQKAMIAKALVQETPFIILDEPTAFLDLPAKIEIMQLLRRLSRNKNRGILLSTHDLEMALQIADKIWLLAQGRTLQEGIPEDLVLSNDFKCFFEREGIEFDNITGSFLYHNIQRKPISIVGTGVASTWVSRALYRIGFEPVIDKCEWKVMVNSDHNPYYSLYFKDQPLGKHHSIEELLNAITEQGKKNK